MKIRDMKELMEFDKSLRSEAEVVYQRKYNLKQEIEKDKEQISKKLWDEAIKAVNLKKKELDLAVLKNNEESEKELSEKKRNLQEKYNENKKQWIEQIVSQSCK
ncbi:MAG: hypothetical protein ACK5LZ_03510 [Anaerorhabdus sp.]